MIYRFCQKHQKGIASFILSIFFSQWCLEGYALKNTAPLFSMSPSSTANRLTHRLPALPGSFSAGKYFETNALPTTSKNPIATQQVIKKMTTKSIRVVTGPGPGQPEMQTFQSISASNMVDLFTGDFSYMIPLLDVGGYPINIHYRSGITMDQEASWVGLGWNINPGTISRNMRGLPDDFNGEDEVIKTNSIRPNWTAGANVGFGLELFGKELNDLGLSASIGSFSLFYNNYRGLGMSAGANLAFNSAMGAKGSFTAGIGLQSNSQSGITISPTFEFQYKSKFAETLGAESSGFRLNSGFSTRTGLQGLSINSVGRMKAKDDDKNTKSSGVSAISNDYSGISFAHQAYTPATNIPFTSYQFSFNLKPGTELFGNHPNLSFGGFYSRQYIAKADTTQLFPAYGYLYYQNAKSLSNALLDYNREKELMYHADPPIPHIAIPSYTYDIYSITAEGSGGMFRPYRGDIGYMRDASVKSKSGDGSISLDLGAGNLVHAGADVRVNVATTENTLWSESNLMTPQIPFRSSDSTFEAVYFKNPAEKTINLQSHFDQLGDTDPVSVVMPRFDDPYLSPLLQRYQNLIPKGVPIKVDDLKSLKHHRDKRSQVISYLTAEDAKDFGLDKKIYSYPLNTFIAGNCDENPLVSKEARQNSFRKKHHLSEITVLNPDGRRYVYGLPVYNLVQKEVSFSVSKEKADLNSGLVEYEAGLDNSTNNNKGKDWFYNAEQLPAYAHSFLLTAIVSPDYMDKTGDGITDDDMGDAVKFNYTKVYGAGNAYKWRTPYDQNKATYNEGLKTDTSDDKGSYVYGEKEVWYLHSVESKTMIATFTIDDPRNGTDKRTDAYGVAGENGGRNDNQPLSRLRRIDLYSKADFIKDKDKARPIKSVFFDYSYELCQNNPSSNDNEGKLTLKRIWFTYNGIEKEPKNPYVFLYHPKQVPADNNKVLTADNEAKQEYNPNHDPKGYDRWGTYKSGADNPGGLSNADYPYTLQEGNQGFSKEKQSQNISAWTLTDILTPSAGRINVEYEPDDYAFVQNKRAMQMCTLTGMGNSPNFSEKRDLLYQDMIHDYLYAFIKVPSNIVATNTADQKREIKLKYLDGVDKLYFNLRVLMPADVYGSGEEHVSTYARYEDYGVTEDPSIIWIKLKGTHRIQGGDGDASPLAKTAIQMLRLNLPSKAYPNSDLNGEFDAEAVVRAAFAMVRNLGELFTKFPTQARMLGWAKKFNTNRSFVRLNNPDFKKYGDGLRVKRVTVYDNWATLTNGQEQEATYGQEYDYTTMKDIGGVKMKISSGVAAYEPGIGNDENPFRLPIEYKEQIAPLAPVSSMYSESPLGEMFYPSASVGYSKVRVRTIHHQDVKSATGFDETEFYTSYDFPTIVEHTPLEIRKFNSENLLNLFNLYSKKALTFSQGFKVELNDMNGKMKATASYSEDDPDNAQSYTRYYYKVDDQHAESKHLNNTVAVADSANGHLNMEAQIGKDIELMTDMREQTFMSQGASMEFNVDGFMIGPIPVTIPMPWLMPHLEMRRFRSSAVTKVVNRYGILDKVMVYDKGSLVTTENLLYDGETGDVLLTKTINEFNDPVYQFNYPAHWAYSGMEPAYKNTGAIFNNISFRDGKITHAPGYSDIDRFFESGDEIMVKGGWGRTQLKNGINKCTGFGVCDNTSPVPITTKKLWAVDAAKLSRNPKLKGMYFIDEEGRFFTGDNNRLQIIRSGKRNMPALNIGSVTSLENPLQKVGGKWQLVLDKTTRVVNTAAVSYSDFWQVEDARYQPKTMTIKKNALKKLVLNPVPDAGFSISRDYRLGVWPFVSGYNNYYAFANTPYFEASSNIPGNNGDTRYAHNLESWLKFDLGVLPAGADIVNAQLSLYPHMGEHQEIRGMPRSMEKRNHTNNLPHHYTDEAGGNESYVHIDFNPTLNNLNPQNSFVDNSPLIRGILDTKTYLSTQKAIVYSTKKQNSVLLNVKDLITASLDRRGATATWFRIKGPESKGYRRLCFWSTDSYLNPFASDEDCIAMYGPLNNSDPNANNSNFGTNPSTRTSNRLDEGAVALDIGQINNNNSANAIGCPTCSAVDPGYGKFPCPTRPQLTIEYIACEPGFSLIQECDSFYCVKTVPVEDCLSRITDTTANPYRWGILGNWRVEKAYSYYDDRTEKNIPGNNNNTNIREYGTVNNFKAFWKFTDKGITPVKDTTKWVWNTHSTLFNRKGFELENKDPLNRHNAVQYGYNESMPIAVTQNARYTEHAFDGFEDYAYKNEPCETPCKVQKHTDNQSLNDYVTSEDAHSGLYSLGIDVGNSIAFSAPIEDASLTLSDPVLLGNIDTSYRYTIKNITNGTGLKATVYKNYDYWTDNYGLDQYNVTTWRPPFLPPQEYFNLNVNYNLNNLTLRTKLGLGLKETFYKIVWEGYLTLRKPANGSITDPEGTYQFAVKSDNSFKFWIDDKLIINGFPNEPVRYFNTIGHEKQTNLSYKLSYGKVYKIRVEHTNGEGAGYALLNWKKPNDPNYQLIPVQNFHSALAAAQAAIKTNQTRCITWEGIRPSANTLYEEFSPKAAERYLVSAWVKEQQDCKCENYVNASIEVAFIGNQGNEIAQRAILKPAGNIIEGWQRIEEIISIPQETSKIQIYFKAAQGNGNTGKIYFDDWRFLPYHGNMKSFVYHPVNLRLMSELDENNYATFYEYDDEGTLIRVKKESERGIQTIRETRSSLRKD